MSADRPSPTQKPVRDCHSFRTRSLPVHLAGYGLAPVVVTATFLLYGVVLGLQVLVGEMLVLQALEETPWILVTLAGVVYIWFVNRRWRAGVSG